MQIQHEKGFESRMSFYAPNKFHWKKVSNFRVKKVSCCAVGWRHSVWWVSAFNGKHKLFVNPYLTLTYFSVLKNVVKNIFSNIRSESTYLKMAWSLIAGYENFPTITKRFNLRYIMKSSSIDLTKYLIVIVAKSSLLNILIESQDFDPKQKIKSISFCLPLSYDILSIFVRTS